MSSIDRAPMGGLGLCGLLAAGLLVVGCGVQQDDAGAWADEFGGGTMKAPALEWEACRGRYCAFQGTRWVRYANSEPREFTDGVWCFASLFRTLYVPRATCYIGTEIEPEPDAGMPDEDGGMTGGTTGGTMGGTMGGMTGPYINVDAIPTGSPGFSTPRVASTSEVPRPSSDGTGSFRTVCGFSHMNFDDPIVYPNQPGLSHLHAYFGNTEADAFSTEESLATGNSTCRGGTVNRSAYWVPAVVDSAGTPMTPRDLIVYYKSGYGGVAPQDVQLFPHDLKIIAGGDPSDPSTLPSWRIRYQCLEDRVYTPYRRIPSCTPGTVMLMVIQFPQCWDGVNLDSPDHRSHMAYPSNGCPATHPVALPEVTYNVNYVVPPQGSTDWRLVSDMDSESDPGISLHSDWISAWDQDIAGEMVDNCVRAGVDCHAHLLGPYRAIY